MTFSRLRNKRVLGRRPPGHQGERPSWSILALAPAARIAVYLLPLGGQYVVSGRSVLGST